MPIPAKDLALLVMEVYTWGGPGGNPNSSVAPHDPETVGRVKNVREIYADWEKSWRHMPSPKRARN
jgi:hypothetical protein